MADEISTLLNYAYFYLRFRPRTEREMREYLEKKAKKFKFSVSAPESAMKRLEELKLVDDRQFAIWYIEIRGSSKKKSRRLLQQELRLKGIPTNVITAYFEEHERDEYSGAVRALQAQWRRYQGIDRRKRFEKAAAHLQRKGFGYSITKRAIAELEEKE